MIPGIRTGAARLIVSFVAERTAKPKAQFYSDPVASHGNRVKEYLADPEPG